MVDVKLVFIPIICSRWNQLLSKCGFAVFLSAIVFDLNLVFFVNLSTYFTSYALKSTRTFIFGLSSLRSLDLVPSGDQSRLIFISELWQKLHRESNGSVCKQPLVFCKDFLPMSISILFHQLKNRCNGCNQVVNQSILPLIVILRSRI